MDTANRHITPWILGARAILTVLALVLSVDGHTESPLQPKRDYTKLFPAKAHLNGVPLLRPVEVLKLDPSRNLSVQISAKKSCFIGDLDLILAEMSWGKFTDLLVTLEPIDDTTAKGSSVILPIERLKDQKEIVELKVPNVSAPTPMGLFICKDVAHTGSCRNKEVVSPGTLAARYDPQAEPAKLNLDKDFPDKVYYFAHLVVEPNSVSSSEAVFDKAERARIEGIAKKESPQLYAKKMERIDLLHGTLSSVPLAQSDGNLQIILPISDFPNCS